ncbi:cytosine deaminase [Zopfochytrium polystomum]|nr:cytosine deaminase [Zopfochytrium polystomum]
MSSLTDAGALDLAIAEAKAGRKEGGIPIGAVLYNHVTGQLIGSGRNQRVQMGSSIRHGETDCLEKCGRLPASVYKQCTMVTTLSPCDMCTGAMLLYKIPRCVIGENRSFVGGEELLKARGVEVVVLDSKECVEMMAEFTAAEPRLWDEDIGE